MDHLLERGCSDLTAVDLSTSALAEVRERLGPAGDDVVLEVADVLDLVMGRRYALWHDRAVYHFLTEPDEREDYLRSLRRQLEPGGWVVVATFGPDGPTTCSGLPIVRYTHAGLAAQFPGFELVDAAGRTTRRRGGWCSSSPPCCCVTRAEPRQPSVLTLPSRQDILPAALGISRQAARQRFTDRGVV